MPIPTPELVSCFGCRHFRVTHARDWPYACAHFGIRARRLPSVVVEQEGGGPCAARESPTAEIPRGERAADTE